VSRTNIHKRVLLSAYSVRSTIFTGDKENNEVTKHQSRVLKETMCKVPRSRVVKVIDHYPSSNKKYLPSCTVLHLCADDTGCCGSPMLKCGPKSSEPILLHFIVYVSIHIKNVDTAKRYC